MNYISKTTWDKLKERGVDPIRLGSSPDYNVTPEMVIQHLREEYGIIVDVRYSNKNVMWPVYYSLIFKKNSTHFWRRVPQKCNSYTEMADYAIQDAINLL